MFSASPKHQAILEPERLLLLDLRKSLKAGCEQNIIWATTSYEELGTAFSYDAPITFELTAAIKPRVLKAQQEQDKRTRSKAEVYTPSWLCNAQNNLVDAHWLAPCSHFNLEQGKSWRSCPEPIIFAQGKTWHDYVSANRLEVTCGEAPYLVSRYDAVTGAPIPVSERIGLLDRKLRVVGENTKTPAQWLKWAHKAFQSSYGFELQGDSLFLARINLLRTFSEYYEARWSEHPKPAAVLEVANIIVRNIWQMDGLKEDWNQAILDLGTEPQLIAEEHYRGHNPHFSRFFMAYTIAHEYLHSIGKTDIVRGKNNLIHNLEQRLFAQVNAVPDARLEELWNAAAMDFVLNEIDARRKIGELNALFSPAPEPMITFWERCIAPLPSLEEFPDSDYHTDHSDWYEKQYKWSELRKEWLALAKWPQSS